MTSYYEPEAQILGIKLEMDDTLATVEIVWRHKDDKNSLKTIEITAGIPQSGVVADDFATARRAILRVASAMDAGYPLDDEETETGMGWQ